MNWIFFIVCYFVSATTYVSCSKTNLLIFLTDDQDLLLGGITPMKKTQKLIVNLGVTFTNAFVTTPVCCPSRSSFLSGLYQHNHRTLNNSHSGGCSGSFWQQEVEPRAWPVLLHDAGYLTFYAGKYLNQYGTRQAGGTKHVPPGWDWWIGLVGNSRYYNYTLSVNGSEVFHENDYLTDLIKDYGLEFLRQGAVKEKNFLMVLAPPAPHAPFTPAPKYDGYYRNVTVMKTPNFNVPVDKDKHWLLQLPPSPLPDDIMPELDRIYRQRWETLLSVDDMVETIIMQLSSLGLLENTHVMLTSDHGFHIGQFSMPWDKRLPYEMDIRIPLIMRGPGIPHKVINSQPVLNIDFSPTFLVLAGLQVPASLDGKSFLPLYKETEDRRFLIEYHGEGSSHTVSPECPYHDNEMLSNCIPENLCKCEDSKNNTFSCVRHVGVLSENNFIFCIFKDTVNFKEAYDLNKDPYQLENVAPSLSPEVTRNYTTWLEQLEACSGKSCQLL